ncbi:hypothetical protein BAUCODRAFT_389945 [Baudoinia panamericana UAMH 10762]|uniref:Potassium transport protein n=1 Tax=Baudoinia panamericana (strain UAMH 10762) TaxID=717646 RepID=M2LWN9_BAUPA|nr:uncharacterized protein BAUCODRAFT_389945 [Baudoinia panamericana UAMH 10762]EMC99077.1 hypothetical protein BAUCODRAFT_389945 [Baudoinia panamericana UAMH 10762]
MARMLQLKAPNLGPLNKPLRWMGRQLPPLNFISVHWAYFCIVCLNAAWIFYVSNTETKVTFTDSLFLSVSAMTEAGLNTVNLSELNTFQQFILFFLIILGSAIFVSAWIVQVRKVTFERKFRDFLAAQRRRRERSRSRSRVRARTWSRRRSGSATRGVEAGKALEEKDHLEPATENQSITGNETGQIPRQYSALDGIVDAEGRGRDMTPPARRGGAEMNDNAVSDGEEETLPGDNASSNRGPTPGITFAGDTRFGPTSPIQDGMLQPRRRRNSNIFNFQGVGARPDANLSPTTPSQPTSTAGQPANMPAQPHGRSLGDISQYFESATGWIARNSQFHGLSEKEREKLGGCEYRAISLLSWLVPVYFVLWQFLGAIGCAAWVAHNAASTARMNGLNPWWVGAFNAVSAFNNSGMSLLDANMTAFQRSYYMLITMSMLILAGNTCYPIFLRLIIWCMWKFVTSGLFKGEEWDERAQTLRFLLDHPRRCYTNLFPAQHTWWLLFALVMLNGIDWAAFEVLNIGNSQLNSGLPTNIRVIDGLFQAFAVRSGGFYVVAIPSVRISLQALYVVMMYISVYPVVITMRNSNVYEERSLGIYAEDQEDDDEDKDGAKSETGNVMATGTANSDGFFLRRAKTIRSTILPTKPGESNSHFVRHQLRAQLAHDAWWIVLALILIMIIENPLFVENPSVFSVFNFLFEIVSAYGCVGISVGLPWAAYSFCGSWHTLSKLILCAVMLRGRHRGLPVAIDRAVLLPGEETWRAEEEDGRIRIARTMSRGRGEMAV